MAGAPVSAFDADLGALGFRVVQDRGTGTVQFARQISPYLTFWVHWNTDDATALFTWELAIGEYLNAHEMQIGSNEALNQFMFPKYDARGPAEIAFVVSEMDRAERILGGVNLLGSE